MAPSSGGLRLLRFVGLLLFRDWAGHLGLPVAAPPITSPRPFALPRLNRGQRSRLTRELNTTWQACGARSWAPLPPWQRITREMFRRQRCRRRRRHITLLPRRSLWAGWPQRACRIGEASNPGPPTPGTPVGSERTPRERSPPRRAPIAAQRVFCPVPQCPCSDAMRARGWTNVASMKHHIDAHLAGSLQGDVPTTWLESNNRTRCLVCGLSVSHTHGIHPTCRPAARAAAVDPAQPMDTDALQLPTLTAIQATKTATLRHVPSAARHSWNQVLTRALAAVVHNNDDKAWRELLMLPKCVLCAPPRGGRRHAKAVGAYTLDRLQRWQEGERLTLWDSRPQVRPHSRQTLTTEQRQALATNLAREGFDRKACAALVSSGLCPPSSQTAEALRALHPQQPAPPVPRLNDLPLAPEIAPALVARCLRAFPADTAPGPTGLRVQHLKDAAVAGSQDAFFFHLAAMVTLMVQGRVPDFVAPVLAGAGLVALPKPNGGVRPIAV